MSNERLTSPEGIAIFRPFLLNVIEQIETQGPNIFRLAFGETRGRRIYNTVFTGATYILECLNLCQVIQMFDLMTC